MWGNPTDRGGVCEGMIYIFKNDCSCIKFIKIQTGNSIMKETD